MDQKETPLKQIRTFQGDVAEALRRERGSLVSIQQAEHLKNDSTQSATRTPGKNSRTITESFFLVLGSLLLFSLGALGAWYAYNEFASRTATQIITAPANRFVSTNAEVTVMADSSRETLVKTLTGAIENVALGEIKHVVLIKEGTKDGENLLPASEFLATLDSRAPSSLLRAFDPLFMFGALGQSTFLIIKLVSFENTFAGMLLWEKDLSRDIGPLFATAELLRNIPSESTFIDIVDKNKDVRVLTAMNQPVLLYSFFDNNTLIITDAIETLRTLVDRLTREKLSR